MGSTITAATADLYARLAALAVPAGTLEGVQVTFGEPGDYEDQQVVALMGVTSPEQQGVALDVASREEHYNIEVGVKVHDPTEDSAQTVFGRSRELCDAIANAVHGSPEGRTLGGAVAAAQVVSQETESFGPAAAGGWVIVWRLFVACVGYPEVDVA